MLIRGYAAGPVCKKKEKERKNKAEIIIKQTYNLKEYQSIMGGGG